MYVCMYACVCAMRVQYVIMVNKLTTQLINPYGRCGRTRTHRGFVGEIR